MKFYHFEHKPLDFRRKRLGLVHNPKTQNTIPGGTINEIGAALLEFKKSFLPNPKK